MRPRRKVVVLAHSEDQISDWRMLLETRGWFSVLPALTLGEALERLDAEPDCYLVLTLHANRATIQTMRCGRDVRVLLVDCTEAEALLSLANRVCVSGTCLPARVMDTLRTLAAKKTGSKAVKKPVESVAIPVSHSAHRLPMQEVA